MDNNCRVSLASSDSDRFSPDSLDDEQDVFYDVSPNTKRNHLKTKTMPHSPKMTRHFEKTKNYRNVQFTRENGSVKAPQKIFEISPDVHAEGFNNLKSKDAKKNHLRSDKTIQDHHNSFEISNSKDTEVNKRSVSKSSFKATSKPLEQTNSSKSGTKAKRCPDMEVKKHCSSFPAVALLEKCKAEGIQMECCHRKGNAVKTDSTNSETKSNRSPNVLVKKNANSCPAVAMLEKCKTEGIQIECCHRKSNTREQYPQVLNKCTAQRKDVTEVEVYLPRVRKQNDQLVFDIPKEPIIKKSATQEKGETRDADTHGKETDEVCNDGAKEINLALMHTIEDLSRKVDKLLSPSYKTFIGTGKCSKADGTHCPIQVTTKKSKGKNKKHVKFSPLDRKDEEVNGEVAKTEPRSENPPSVDAKVKNNSQKRYPFSQAKAKEPSIQKTYKQMYMERIASKKDTTENDVSCEQTSPDNDKLFRRQEIEPAISRMTDRSWIHDYECMPQSCLKTKKVNWQGKRRCSYLKTFGLESKQTSQNILCNSLK